MSDTPTPPRAQSIEELFKKPEPAAAAPSSAAPTAKKPKAKAVAPKAKGAVQKLEEKIGDVRLHELEKATQEKSRALGLPYLDFQNGYPITPEAISILTRAEAVELKAVVFFRNDEQIRIAALDRTPAVKKLMERLSAQFSAEAALYIISPTSFDIALKVYAALPEIKEVIYGVRIEEATLQKYATEITDLKKLQETITKVSTTDVIALLIGGSLKLDASDIHIEAEEKDVKVRYRIDGDLRDAAFLPKDAWKQMIARLKLLAGVKMNIEDVPQDGRITIYLSNEKIDIRVSFLPTAFGESVVMRLLRPKSIALEFEQLGVRGRAWEALKREIERPNGMIITTGPTGSGKTTTLYAMLKRLNTEDVKIITLEDPIEYKLQGINQSQVDYSKDYTFVKGLRSILRQDPDVVMVGEIRDLETAEIAIQAALTGHLVVSTIHTNSAAGAIPRFLSMGVKPFLLAPAINCVIGQRLVKRINPEVKEEVTLTQSLLAQVRAELSHLSPEIRKEYKVDLDQLKFYGPKKDAPQPYKGRVGIYEIFSMNKDIEKLILSGHVSEYEMVAIAQKGGMITMAQDGLLKALDGLTTVEEVLRAAEMTSVLEEGPEEEPTEPVHFAPPPKAKT